MNGQYTASSQLSQPQRQRQTATTCDKFTSSASCLSLTQSLPAGFSSRMGSHCSRRSVKATRPPIKTKHGHCLLTAMTHIATVLIHNAFKPPKQPLARVQIPHFIPSTVVGVLYSVPSQFLWDPIEFAFRMKASLFLSLHASFRFLGSLFRCHAAGAC